MHVITNEARSKTTSVILEYNKHLLVDKITTDTCLLTRICNTCFALHAD